jgi:hypothetical protein
VLLALGKSAASGSVWIAPSCRESRRLFWAISVHKSVLYIRSNAYRSPKKKLHSVPRVRVCVSNPRLDFYP